LGPAVGGVEEREEGGCGSVPALPGAGRREFADIAAAMASLDVASECERTIRTHSSEWYGRSLFTFPAPPELKELVGACGQPGDHDVDVFLMYVPVGELVAAGAPGADHLARLCSSCRAWLSFSFSHGAASPGESIRLSLRIDTCGGSLGLSLSAGIAGGSRLAIGPPAFLTMVAGLADTSEDVKSRLGIPEFDATQLLDLAVWLAMRSKEEWGDTAAGTAAGLASALSPAIAAALHEVRRALGVQVGGLGLPAIEDVAEEVRRKALEAYPAVAGAAAPGHRPLPREVREVRIGGHLTVGEVWKVLRRVVSMSSAEQYARLAHTAAEEALSRAVRKAAELRAAAEVLASLSEPE